MTIAIIDDFEADRARLLECVCAYMREAGEARPRILQFESGAPFLAALAKTRFDMVLLDCCMNELDGLETACEFRKHDTQAMLIFVTSSSDYAVDGYLVDAAGYLMKPFDEADFTRVFLAARHRLPRRPEYITLPGARGEIRVAIDAIVYCDISGHYLQCHLKNGHIVRARLPFAKFSAQLADYPQFMKCYRGCIINLEHVQRAEALNFLMNTGERVPFRVKEQGKMMKQYSDYLFDKVRTEEA